jgi:hypothetical protein
VPPLLLALAAAGCLAGAREVPVVTAVTLLAVTLLAAIPCPAATRNWTLT